MKDIYVATYFEKQRPVLTGAQALRMIDADAARYLDRMGNPERRDVLDRHPSRKFARDDDWFTIVTAAYSSDEERQIKQKEAREAPLREQVRKFRLSALEDSDPDVHSERSTKSLSLPSPDPITLEEMMETTAFVLPELSQMEGRIPELPPATPRIPLQRFSNETGDLFEAAGIVVKAAPPIRRRRR